MDLTVSQIIAEEIRRGGVMPFHRFMELALYHSDKGYYETANPVIGKEGDFFTSVSVGSLLGELLATQINTWMQVIPEKKCQVIEAGAHHGQLAMDILLALKSTCPPGKEIEYWIIEPSQKRQTLQREALGSLVDRVRWLADWREVGMGGIDGIILSNELLDAFPVHRVGWDARDKHWYEWGVVSDGTAFAWHRMADSAERASTWVSQEAHASSVEIPETLLEVLPDGFTLDLCPAARDWWRHAAEALHSGFLMTIDYGLEFVEFFSPARAHGTLRAYQRHVAGLDTLKDPGERDLTASVNFSALLSTGEAQGLKTVAFSNQDRFLNSIVTTHPALSQPGSFWTPERIRQFNLLMHPDHMGAAFRVLAQRR